MSSKVPESARLAWRNLIVNMDPASLVVIVGLPAMYLVLMGTMFSSLISSVSENGVSFQNYVSFLAGGIIAFQTVIAGNVGGGMLWLDRRFGMFSQILAGPFTRAQYLLGIILAATVASLAGAAIMLLIAYPLGVTFHFTLPGLGLLLLNLVIGAIFFCSLMLLIAARVDSSQAYNSIQILILFVINFVSDVFYTLGPSTPLPLRVFSLVNPLTYIADGVRAGLVDPSLALSIWNPLETIVLVIETVAIFAVAFRTYSKVKLSTS